MNTKTQRFLKSKNLLIATFALFMTAACTNEANDTNDVKPVSAESIKNNSLTKRTFTTFNFAPTLIRYQYNIAGLGLKKTPIVNAAIGLYNDPQWAAYAVAIAMQETEVLTGNTGETSGEYPWMDSKSDAPKSGDSACFGIYKMGWYMIRNSQTMKNLNGGQVLSSTGFGTYQDYNSWGNKINRDVTLATKILLEHYMLTMKQSPKGTSADGLSSGDVTEGRPYNFWGGHRYGQTGWNGGTGDFKTGSTLAKNFTSRNGNVIGWQDCINYWYAVWKTKTEIEAYTLPGVTGKGVQVFKKDNQRIARDIYNI